MADEIKYYTKSDSTPPPPQGEKKIPGYTGKASALHLVIFIMVAQQMIDYDSIYLKSEKGNISIILSVISDFRNIALLYF